MATQWVALVASAWFLPSPRDCQGTVRALEVLNDDAQPTLTVESSGTPW